MLSRLKSLELFGYKTFANKTLFEFSGRVTSIIGPNGSGKSNIADSLRWVLGEQSYRLLRGKKTEDMIFSGSEFRPRLGMASATITFDNSDGWLPIDFSEVAITRRAYRDGQKEYLINGQRVRLKDVTELLAESGLAERTYTIIGQGLVDAALSLKAEERRKLFEEAAGIGLYRSRREQALRRLESTRHNIERVQDILSELKPRLRSLERQARRAKDYEQVKSDLKAMLLEWYGYHWRLLQEKVTREQAVTDEWRQSLSKIKQEQQLLENQSEELYKKVRELRVFITNNHRELSELHSKKENISREYSGSKERIRSLKEQIERTQSELNKLLEDKGTQKAEIDAFRSEIVAQTTELDETKKLLELSREKLKKQESMRVSLEKELQTIQNELILAESRLSQNKVYLTEKEEQLKNINKQISQVRDLVSSLKKQLEEREKKLVDLNQQFNELQVEYEHQRKIIEKLENDIDQKQKDFQNVEGKINDLLAKKTRLVSELEILEQAENSLVGYKEGTQTVMKAFDKGELGGVLGILVRNLEIEPDYDIAISAALGEYLDSILLEDDLDAALDVLKKRSKRGVLIPVKALKTKKIDGLALDKEGILGMATQFVKISEPLKNVVELLLGDVVIVKTRKTAKKIIGDNRIMNVRVVTLSGEVFYTGGQVYYHGVSNSDERQDLISRQRQIKKIKDSIKRHEKDLEKQLHGKAALENEIEILLKEKQREGDRLGQYDTERKQYAGNLRKLEIGLEKAKQEIQWAEKEEDKLSNEYQTIEKNIQDLEQKINVTEEEIPELEKRIKEKQVELYQFSPDELKAEVSHWEITMAVLERSVQSTNDRLSERLLSLEQLNQMEGILKQRVKDYENSLGEFQNSIQDLYKQEELITGQINEIHTRLQPAEVTLPELEQKHNTLQADLSLLREKVSKEEQNYSKARISLARIKEKILTLQNQIESDFGLVDYDYAESVDGPTPLPLAGFVEQLPEVDKISPELEEAIRRLKVQIRRMGAINPEAENEYLEVKERFDFMTSQIEDLNKAEIDIHAVIDELDEIMAKEFKKTFEQVAEEFREIFKRLFGGGCANLFLTDKDDVMDAGIEIDARLPGRRTQGLSLLSGGERSLTATALIFALLRVSPTPFCLLDEVDAMLDEANAGRFRDLLWEMSENTQFIIVTHNRNTVQAADVIYGITMGRDSSSKVISLKVDEVGEMVE